MFPLTGVTSKHLLPVYDKPMVYYPLVTLMEMGVRDVLLISTPQDTAQYRQLLGDGARFGVSVSYAVQPKPEGIAQAFVLGRGFVGGEPCVLILGDNIFWADGFSARIGETLAGSRAADSAVIFCRSVQTPQDFGIAELDDACRVLSIEEKPAAPKSRNAVTGLYVFPPDVCEIVKQVRPSARGELEITSLLELYRAGNRLAAHILDDDCFWIDAGSFDRLAEAALFVQDRERRTARLIGSPEATAYQNGWITREALAEAAARAACSPYGAMLAHAFGLTV